MVLYILLAGRIIKIIHQYNSIKKICEDYLIVASDYDIIILVEREDLFYELDKYVHRKNNARYQVRKTASELECSNAYRKIITNMIGFDTIMIHGVLVAVENDGYLIAAKSGVGKTTRAKIWLDTIEGSYIVNGDKPLLHVEDNLVTGYGTPWCGKEGYNTNTSVTLKGICFLERSEENSIEEISYSQSFPKLLDQTFKPESGDGKVKVLSLLSKMKNSVKFYRLQCNLDPEGAIMAYEYMKSREEV